VVDWGRLLSGCWVCSSTGGSNPPLPAEGSGLQWKFASLFFNGWLSNPPGVSPQPKTPRVCVGSSPIWHSNPGGLTELKTPGVYVESSPTWHSNPGGLTTNKTSGGMRCIFTCLAFKPRGSHRNQRPPGFYVESSPTWHSNPRGLTTN
jgi:hypothetical protein